MIFKKTVSRPSPLWFCKTPTFLRHWQSFLVFHIRRKHAPTPPALKLLLTCPLTLGSPMHCASQQASQNELSTAVSQPPHPLPPSPPSQCQEPSPGAPSSLSTEFPQPPFPLASTIFSLLLYLPPPPAAPIYCSSKADTFQGKVLQTLLFSTYNIFLSYPTKPQGFNRIHPLMNPKGLYLEHPLPSTPEIAVQWPTQVYLTSIPAIQTPVLVLPSLPSLDGNCSMQTPKSQH